MKSMTKLLAIALIIAGVVFLSYSGMTYNKQEKVAEIGNITITAEEKETISFSPIAGAICLVVGIGILLFSRKR